MEILKPKKLQSGMTIGLLAVSGAVKDLNEIEIAKQRLEKSGFRVVVNSGQNYRNMAGTKKECLRNLHSFFENSSIDAIIAIRGGYGTLRFLNDIDFEIIRKNPKIFVGYSDITNLLAIFYKKAGLIGFYGPMALSDFASDFDKIAYYKMLDTLQNMPSVIKVENPKTLYEGSAKGILWGGNLSSLASMCGLDFIPDEDFILFFEDWHDPVYKLDRMFTQLMNIENFKKHLKGIAWGEFLGVEEEEFYLWQNELTESLKIPMAEGFKITHGKNKITVPYGAKVIFNANKAQLEFEQEYLS